MNQNVQLECAWDCAAAIAKLVEPLMPEEERQWKFFVETFRICKQMLPPFLMQQIREAARHCVRKN